jgi:hypothetical protein
MQAYPPAGVIFTGIGVLLSLGIFIRGLSVTLLSGIKPNAASQAALTRIFERIKNFFRRLETYITLPPTSGMTGMTVKVMAEALSILPLPRRRLSRTVRVS